MFALKRQGVLICPRPQHSAQQLNHVYTVAALGDSTATEPWHVGFSCNERYLSWADSAQLQLTKLVLAEKLMVDAAEVDARLFLWTVLLPDFT